MRLPVIGGVALAALFITSQPSMSQNVNAGYDLLTTLEQFQDFAFTPLPAGFFGPGSDPFVGTVAFAGEPMSAFPACGATPLGSSDTVIQRTANANLPTVGSADTVPIQIVAMNLISMNPIVVTYGGGGSPEEWQVAVTLSTVQQSVGTMTIVHSFASGGIFNAQFRVYPRFTFTRPSDGAVRVRDFGSLNLFNNYSVFGGSWQYTGGPLGCLSCAGTNFFPGLTSAGSFISWHCQASNAVHDFLPPCPTEPVATESSSWGTIKASYR